MSILLFEIFVIIISVVLLLILGKKDKNIFKRYLILIIGILTFEFFTQPLWYNLGLDKWAYVYQDVSWILTIGWADILLFSMALVDCLFKLKETKKFFLYLLITGLIAIIAESAVLSLGIREYSPEIQEIMSGITIPFTQTPVEALYYIPVFMALIIGFTRYFEMCFIKIKEYKTKKVKRKRRIKK